MSHTPTETDIAALVADLTTKSAMINMGEKIAWGSETALMDQAAAALIAQDAELKRLTARAEAAEAMADRLAEASVILRDDMLERARCEMDVIHGEEYRVVNAGNGAWTGFCKALSAHAAMKEGR